MDQMTPTGATHIDRERTFWRIGDHAFLWVPPVQGRVVSGWQPADALLAQARATVPHFTHRI